MVGWGTGRRLRDLEAGELLSWAYDQLVANLDAEKRHEIDYGLTPDSIVIEDDPELPPQLQGKRPPSWYRHGAGATSRFTS